MVHNDTLLLSVTPSPLVASAATIDGVTIHENPEPSMGAGKVSSLSLASAVSASIARSTTASFVGGLLGSLAGGTIIAARSRQRDLRTSLIPARCACRLAAGGRIAGWLVAGS